MADKIPGPPALDIVLTYGSDLVVDVARTAAGEHAPFEPDTTAYVRLGDQKVEGSYPCTIVDGVIVMRMEAEILDAFRHGVSYQLLTSLPGGPSTKIPQLAGKLIRE